jgi:hypothetical protein
MARLSQIVHCPFRRYNEHRNPFFRSLIINYSTIGVGSSASPVRPPSGKLLK